uniref:TlpA family protein disulfide reductase n=1 Tax=Eiseniibacteriota bacterium TaxID=2212470 RepID=A0A832HZ04_UNCEI
MTAKTTRALSRDTRDADKLCDAVQARGPRGPPLTLERNRIVRPLAFPTVICAALCAAVLLCEPARAGGSKTAPPFSVRALDGRVVRLSDFKGRAVVMDFWATWCQPCRASMPHLDALQERFEPQGLVVLGLSIDDQPPAAVRRFADKLGVRFRLAMADEQVLDAYGPIRSIPTTFFINRRGEIVRRVVGYIDPETLEAYARELF